MKATATAPANIAFIKYWGNKPGNLPYSDTISMNLSNCITTTTVEWDSKLKRDTLNLDGINLSGPKLERVVKHLDKIRKVLGISICAKVISKNSFLQGAGIASSASGFAALTLAAARAAGGKLSEKRLSRLARLGSGSASRSIPDGFVIWQKGSDKTSYAESIYPPDWWDLRDVIIIVTRKEKAVGSADGHKIAHTSPIFKKRVNQNLPRRTAAILKALKNKDIELLGKTIEEEALELHEVARTSTPPIEYLLEETKRIIGKLIPQWRKEGIPVYFTLDAGPNVHAILPGKYEKQLLSKIKKELPGVELIINKPGEGARLSRSHLF